MNAVRVREDGYVAKKDNMAVSYGVSATWFARGGRQTMTVHGYKTFAEACAQVALSMYNSGWQPAKWWQFWRWSEPTINQDVRIAWRDKTWRELLDDTAQP